jgi:hypothetical protein
MAAAQAICSCIVVAITPLRRMIRSRRNRRAEARIRNQIAGSSSKNEGTKLYCAGGYGSGRIKLSNYLLRPNLAGYASSDGERAGLLSSRNIGISSRRDLKRQFSTDHILPGLRQAAVAFGAIFPRPLL